MTYQVPPVGTGSLYRSSYEVPIDGKVTGSVFLMNNGGLYAEYFNNVFMDGVPEVKRVDPTINFDWKHNLITPEGADFVSIRWYTKLKAPFTEEYTFIIEADDGIRMVFDGKTVIDRWDTCCSQ